MFEVLGTLLGISVLILASLYGTAVFIRALADAQRIADKKTTKMRGESCPIELVYDEKTDCYIAAN